MVDRISFNVVVGRLDDQEPKQLSLECSINDRLIINWEDLPVDVLEIKDSAENSGNYCFWTCTCGNPQCGGVDSKGIKVEHRNGQIVWTELDFPIEGISELKFDRMEYQQKVSLMWKEFKRKYYELKNGQEEFEICPDLRLETILQELRK